MTTTGETRVQPEELTTTYKRLRAVLRSNSRLSENRPLIRNRKRARALQLPGGRCPDLSPFCNTSPSTRPRVYAESMMELDREIQFEPGRAGEFFESLPARPAVVVIKPHDALKGARALLPAAHADLRRRHAPFTLPSQGAELEAAESAAVRGGDSFSRYRIEIRAVSYALAAGPDSVAYKLSPTPPAAFTRFCEAEPDECLSARLYHAAFGSVGFVYGPVCNASRSQKFPGALA